MKFKYKGIEGRFIDFKVVETGFCFTWIRLQYELYENGEVYNQDWTEQEGSRGGNKEQGRSNKDEKEKGLFEKMMANITDEENGNV
jgi:hypothetical protein